LFTWMTGISLHIKWPLSSQSHGSVSQREQKDTLWNDYFYNINYAHSERLGCIHITQVNPLSYQSLKSKVVPIHSVI
jgi:hypothetical protein